MNQNNLVRGIAISKSTELAALNEQVSKAQYKVTQQQAIVDSLTGKAGRFTALLAQATDGRASALANFNLVKDVMLNVRSLASNFDEVRGKADVAATDATHVSGKLSALIGKLIFSVEMIDKVSQVIIKQRANHPSMPIGLLDVMAKAGTAAESAVALALTALQSCYAAESTLMESRAAVSVGADQAMRLKENVGQGWDGKAGDATLSDAELSAPLNRNGVYVLLLRANQKAIANYDMALQNNDSVTGQLTFAQMSLADATTELAAAKRSLSAATAAAYAA